MAAREESWSIEKVAGRVEVNSLFCTEDLSSELPFHALLG
jgi:hypothetical protein